MLQLGVLFRRQAQEHATAAGSDGLIQHQAAYLIGDPAALNQLDHHVGRAKAKLPGQRSLQVSLQELTMPAFSALKSQVDGEEARAIRKVDSRTLASHNTWA
jgi:hypothetical protein